MTLHRKFNEEEEPKDDQMVDTSGSNEMEQETEAHIDEKSMTCGMNPAQMPTTTI